MRDSEIEQRVVRELHFEKDIGSKEICVFCLNGVVTLSGTVLADRNYRAAQTAARRAKGVSMVINTISITIPAENPRTPLVANSVREAHAPGAQ